MLFPTGPARGSGSVEQRSEVPRVPCLAVRGTSPRKEIVMRTSTASAPHSFSSRTSRGSGGAGDPPTAARPDSAGPRRPTSHTCPVIAGQRACATRILCVAACLRQAFTGKKL